VYRDIVGCRQAGDGPAQQRDETRILALMTAAVSISRFQPQTLWMP